MNHHSTTRFLILLVTGQLLAVPFAIRSAVICWGDHHYGKTNVPSNLPKDVVAIACGQEHTLALTSEGRVWHWGQYTGVPSSLSDVVAIAAGGSQGVALVSGGYAVTWPSPLRVPTPNANITAIAAGRDHLVFLYGDGTVVTRLNPGPSLTNVIAIAAGGNHSLALLRDGTVVGWGDNLYFEIENETLLVVNQGRNG